MIRKICALVCVGLIGLAVVYDLQYYLNVKQPKMYEYEYFKISDEPVNKHNVQTKSQKQNSQTIIQKQIDRTTTTLSKSIPINIDELELQIHNEVNRVRSEYGLKTLSFDQTLARIARGHSEDMAQNGYFSHISPNGDDLRDRYSGKVSCFRGGENILKQTMIRSDDVKLIVDSWMNSPYHRANILSNWSRQGIGVAVTNDQTAYITQDFC